MIRMQEITKSYNTAYARLEVLKGINLIVEDGERVSIMGASGSGKSTLLNILGLLDCYDTGKYYIGERLMKDLSEHEAAHYRNRIFGFVFQSAELAVELAQRHKDECQAKMDRLCKEWFPEQYDNLQTIPRVKGRSATAIIAEVGTDMSSFQDAAHLVYTA